MAVESEPIAGGENKASVVTTYDRLSQCASKTWALSEMNFGDLSSSGAEGMVFLLSDLAREIDEIREALWNGFQQQG